MAVHFGIWNFDGKPVDPGLLLQVHALLRTFGCFETCTVRRNSLAVIGGGLGRRSLRSHRSDTNCAELFWDGRLDNREELAALTDEASDSSPDEEIIQRAYARLGSDVFARILGDWALSVVREPEHELILAKDFAGARPLFYQLDGATVVWSSFLELLVLSQHCLPRLSEQYLSAWLAFLPESHLTPYQGILSAPPASFVRITPRGVNVRKYWDLESAKPLRYRSDRQYEEHFLSVFRQAVARRIKSNAPVLAELSGGMDSSSIVCVADRLFSTGVGASRLDTVTYFDSEEPNWDELPYVARVEEKRGRTGHHIDVGPAQSISEDGFPTRFCAVPTSTSARSSAARAFDLIVAENRYSVVLSGLGGDEMLGGVPTPVPELADLLARFYAVQFLRQSFRWAFAKRKPIIGLWRSAFASFLPSRAHDVSTVGNSWTWLTPEFRTRNREHLGLPSARFRYFGSLPSLQANASAAEALSRQISCAPLSAERTYEWRYPFLDRDLVVFCSSIPREQHVRPNQRRSLMRRTMAGIVPQAILERKRKAYVSRGLVKVLSGQWQMLRETPLQIEKMGIVDPLSFGPLVEQAQQGSDVAVLPLLRTLALEQWLRDLSVARRQLDCSRLEESAQMFPPSAPEEFLGREKSRIGRR